GPRICLRTLPPTQSSVEIGMLAVTWSVPTPARSQASLLMLDGVRSQHEAGVIDASQPDGQFTRLTTRPAAHVTRSSPSQAAAPVAQMPASAAFGRASAAPARTQTAATQP